MFTVLNDFTLSWGRAWCGYLTPPCCCHHKWLQHLKDAPSGMLAPVILNFLFSIDLLHLTWAPQSQGHTSRTYHNLQSSPSDIFPLATSWPAPLALYSKSLLMASEPASPPPLLSFITSSISSLDFKAQHFKYTIAIHYSLLFFHFSVIHTWQSFNTGLFSYLNSCPEWC